MIEYPSNSQTSSKAEEVDKEKKELDELKKKYKKRHKKYAGDDDDEEEETTGEKLKKAIFPNGSLKKAGETALLKVIVPMGKDLFLGSINAVLSQTLDIDASKYTKNLFQSSESNDRTRVRSRDYSGIYTRSDDDSVRRYSVSTRRRTRFNFARAWFHTYDSATDCCDTMFDILDQYGKLTVNDFFDLADGIAEDDDDDYTSVQWGWRRLGSNIDIYRDNGLWHIDMPEPVDLRRV